MSNPMSNEERIRFAMMQCFGATVERRYVIAGVYLRVLQGALAKGSQEHICGKFQSELLNAEAGKNAPYLEESLRELDEAVTKLLDPSPIRRAMVGVR